MPTVCLPCAYRVLTVCLSCAYRLKPANRDYHCFPAPSSRGCALRASRFALGALRLALRAWRFAPRASRVARRASRFALRASRVARRALRMIKGADCKWEVTLPMVKRRSQFKGSLRTLSDAFHKGFFKHANDFEYSLSHPN